MGVLERLLRELGGGRSRVVVLRGQGGGGKTELLAGAAGLPGGGGAGASVLGSLELGVGDGGGQKPPGSVAPAGQGTPVDADTCHPHNQPVEQQKEPAL
ncbi:hypothetical protein VM98_38790, partial [Streptomyces rubellomurinus subsp. indigoferus]